jgi:hypothetical protein
MYGASLLVSLALLLSSLTALNGAPFPVCCTFNSVFQANCTCINEGTGPIALSAVSGSYSRFHFMLANYSAITGTSGVRFRATSGSCSAVPY